MPCAWTISAGSQPLGTYRRGADGANRPMVPGPGAEFFRAVQRERHGLPFIAEDLGLIIADVAPYATSSSLLGTRVLQFAFDGHSDNPHLPHNYSSNTVVYTGIRPARETSRFTTPMRRVPGRPAETPLPAWQKTACRHCPVAGSHTRFRAIAPLSAEILTENKIKQIISRNCHDIE